MSVGRRPAGAVDDDNDNEDVVGFEGVVGDKGDDKSWLLLSGVLLLL